LISAENYDKLVEQLNEPPKPIPGLIELMNRKTPFENVQENTIMLEDLRKMTLQEIANLIGTDD
jgi:hypothetical protein